jgi:hypothetical protein
MDHPPGERHVDRRALRLVEGDRSQTNLAGAELGLGPATDPHDGRVDGQGTAHGQHLHDNIFNVVPKIPTRESVRAAV